MHTSMRLALVLSMMICTLAVATADQATSPKRRADAVVAKYATPAHPGCAVGVYQDGRTLYEGAHGLANLEHAVAISPDTVFGVGSVSKQFTAASVLLLAQDGKLKLEDDIRAHLPEIPDYGNVITIDQLLHNTSGLRDYVALQWMMGTSWWAYTTEHETLDIIAGQRRLNFSPGSKYSYSNSNYFLLSVIVRRVSGQTLADFAHARIFTPLGMAHTYFSVAPGRVTPHHASGYALLANGAFEARSTRSLAYGDSGLQTTLADLAKWQRNFDVPTVGGTSLIQQLEQNGVLNDGTKIEYARGLEVFEEGRGYRSARTVLHNGATWDGYRSDVMRLTAHKFSTAVLCNSDDAKPDQVRNELADLFLEGKFADPTQEVATGKDAEPQPAPSPSDKDLLNSFVGIFWNREDILIRRIEFSDGKLWYVRSPESRTELVSAGNGQLRMVGVPTRTIVEKMLSKTGRQTVRVVGRATSIMEKVEPFSPADLSDYAGTYSNRELGNGRIVLDARDGKLVLLESLDETETLTPVFKDAFDIEGEALLVFQRNTSGRVTSLVVDHERARAMVFTRAPR